MTQVMWLNYAAITSTTGAGASKLIGVAQLMHVSEFKITQLANINNLLFLPFAIPAGILIDRKGFRYSVMLGAVLTAGFSFLRMFSGNYLLVFIGMAGIAIGGPFVLIAITKMVSAWFPTEESALATGIAALSMFLGMIVALALTPALLKAFGDTLSGVRWLVLVYSLAATVSVILFWMFAKGKPPKPPKRTEQELQEEGAAFKLLCIIMFLGFGAVTAILQLIDQILKPKGISSTTSGLIGAVMVIAGVIGCVVIPALSDKYRRRKPFILLSAGMAVPGLFLMAQLSSTTQIYLVSVFTGFFLVAAYPVVLTLNEETTGHGLTGTASAILMLLGNLGGWVLTLLMEAIKGVIGGTSFYWPMIFLTGLIAAAFVVALFIRENNARFGVDLKEPSTPTQAT